MSFLNWGTNVFALDLCCTVSGGLVVPQMRLSAAPYFVWAQVSNLTTLMIFVFKMVVLTNFNCFINKERVNSLFTKAFSIHLAIIF